MSRAPSRRLSTVMAAVALILATDAAAEVELLIVDDSVRIDPVHAVVIERGPALGSLGPADGYLRNNPVWDGERGRVELLAARNETVAFQAVVVGSGEPIEDLRIDLAQLRGPAELRRGQQIRIFRQWYVEVTGPSEHDRAAEQTTRLDAWFPVKRYSQRLVNSFGAGWYPDPLIPLDGPAARLIGAGPISVPSEENPVPGQRAQAFWIEVFLPADAAAGRYEGRLEVTWRGGAQAVPVMLEALPVTLPETFHSGIGSVSYDFIGVHLAGQGAAAVQRLYRLLHRHRLTADALYVQPDWEDGEIDWDRYDQVYGPLLDGSAFTREAGYFGPGEGRPVRRFVLPLDWNWPTRQRGVPAERPFVSALEAVEEHILERGWTSTEWHLFINLTDEPTTPEDFALIRAYGELLDRADLRRPELFVHRTDAGPFKSIGREIEGWTVAHIFDEIGDVVDVWNACGGVPYVPTAALAERLEAQAQEQQWFYFSNAAGEPAVGSLLIDGEALGPRTWGWILWRYDFDAGVSWELGWPTPRCLRRPDCSGYGLWGDASLVYLADALGAPGWVLPSIRLASLRRGAQDYEYLWLLDRSGHRALADAWAGRLVPRALDDGVVARMNGAWEHDPAAWEKARRAAGLVLAGRSEPPEPAEVLAGAPPVVLPSPGLSRRASLFFAVAFVVVILIAVFLTEPRRRSARGDRRG